jgi:hypothetical protein
MLGDVLYNGRNIIVHETTTQKTMKRKYRPSACSNVVIAGEAANCHAVIGFPIWDDYF